MSMPVERLLAVLQQGDSAFPSGGFAFSWGLEELATAGWIAGPDDVAGFLDDMLRHRWAGFERVAVAAAHGAETLEAVAAVDGAVETATVSAAARAGSRRAGRALLGVHARLAGGDAAAYRALAEADATRGHLPVVQGLVWRIAGLDAAEAEALSAWTMAQGIVQAALRLGLVGHLTAQRLLTGARAVAARLSAVPAPAALTAFTTVADVALARHARRDARLFAT